VYALRSNLSGPHQAVAVDPTVPDQEPAPLPTPGHPLAVTPPGRVEELVTEAADGTPIRAWLVLPPGASAATPVPLATFIHGGPVAAWGDWSWRWNPQLLAARGWAVVLPNPALSTGFGHAFVQRGWGRWGAEPFTDIMAVVDAACARPDIDEQRTAALGPSFGGYMANWVAGHTDRFKCIVSHAGIWSLEQFHGTTDLTAWWEYEFGNPDVDNQRYIDNSPDRHSAAITTPMLVVHGRLDERVPVSEGLHLWTDLVRYGVEAKLLFFPDENHWILKPPNVRVWHEAIFAWLDHHVLGEEWRTPALL
jgi:dipeptidyl aminopeptidase/acylaminoacyl peptidase